MKRNLNVSRWTVMLSALAILLGGCFGTSKSARFYTLSSLPHEGGKQAAPTRGHALTVGLGPVLFPPYMDRPQIVTRLGPNEVRIHELHRWAAPAKDLIRNVLRDDLEGLLSGDDVVLYPWKGDLPVDYRVEIRINRFDGNPGDAVTLATAWRVTGPDGIKVLLAGTSSIRVPLTGTDFESLVAAKSRALGEFSREIARAIDALPPPPAAP